MARSIRSKRVRETKTAKRVKYGKKELAKLKEIVKNREQREELAKNSSDVITKLKEEPEASSLDKGEKKTKKLTSKYNSFTLRDKHGHLPVWMNSKAKRRHKRIMKKSLRNQKKKK